MTTDAQGEAAFGWAVPGVTKTTLVTCRQHLLSDSLLQAH